jgi:hypothetical protein
MLGIMVRGVNNNLMSFTLKSHCCFNNKLFSTSRVDQHAVKKHALKLEMSSSKNALNTTLKKMGPLAKNVCSQCVTY